MVVGITRSLNEADLIEYSIGRMLLQVDHIIIGDNSTDGTRETLDRMVAAGRPITLLDDEALNFEQRDVMTLYARMAKAMGGTWGVFFDIDEAWYADGGSIAQVLSGLPDHVLLAPARNVTHCATSEDDPGDPDPMSRMGWRNAEMLPLVKIACRLRDDLSVGHGNHSVHYDQEHRPAAVNDVLESRHFPYRTPEQFIKRVRHAWPMIRDSGLPETHGAHMWAYGRHLDEFGEEGLRRWFFNGMFFENPAGNPELVYDPLPPFRLSSPGDQEAAVTGSAPGTT
jgi:hypothetical protein